MPCWILDDFNASLFDWGAAWDGYEVTQAIALSKLQTSFKNFRIDQQRLTAALVFVTGVPRTASRPPNGHGSHLGHLRTRGLH
jgi:hypothetical protein